MTTALVKQEQSFDYALLEVENIQKMSQKLLQMKHFQKLGDVGIFAILQKAKSIGLDPLDALNGGCYFVNGKVELSANTMNYLIRKAGHSIVKDEKSTKEICILRGRRVDNGDTSIASFSIEDAKKAGIYKNVWTSYPEDMLFARALTRLARQLFPDVCKGCYIEGEIHREIQDISYDIEVKTTPLQIESKKEEPEYITLEQAEEVEMLLSLCNPEKLEKIKERLEDKTDSKGYKFIKKECYPKIKNFLNEQATKYQDSIKAETVLPEEINE